MSGDTLFLFVDDVDFDVDFWLAALSAARRRRRVYDSSPSFTSTMSFFSYKTAASVANAAGTPL